MEPRKKIILFDGVCNLCNDAIQFVIKRDTKDVFRYAPFQSEVGKRLTAERAIDIARVDSIILIEPEVAYFIKSEAVLRIGQEFGGCWKALVVFTWIPKPIRDAVYNFIARNRYRWFGKRDVCMIPTPELKAKFHIRNV